MLNWLTTALSHNSSSFLNEEVSGHSFITKNITNSFIIKRWKHKTRYPLVRQAV